MIEGTDPSSSLYEKVIFPKYTWEVSVNASRKVVEGLQDCGIICHQSNGSYNSLTYHTGLSTCSFAKVCFVLLRIINHWSDLSFQLSCLHEDLLNETVEVYLDTQHKETVLQTSCCKFSVAAVLCSPPVTVVV